MHSCAAGVFHVGVSVDIVSLGCLCFLFPALTVRLHSAWTPPFCTASFMDTSKCCVLYLCCADSARLFRALVCLSEVPLSRALGVSQRHRNVEKQTMKSDSLIQAEL